MIKSQFKAILHLLLLCLKACSVCLQSFLLSRPEIFYEKRQIGRIKLTNSEIRIQSEQVLSRLMCPLVK